MNGFIYSSVWEFNRKKWNSYNGMLLFHSLLNLKHSSQKWRNIGIGWRMKSGGIKNIGNIINK